MLANNNLGVLIADGAPIDKIREAEKLVEIDWKLIIWGNENLLNVERREKELMELFKKIWQLCGRTIVMYDSQYGFPRFLEHFDHWSA